MARIVEMETGYTSEALAAREKKEKKGMISLASVNMLLALFSMAVALAALALLAFIIFRDHRSNGSVRVSRSAKRTDSFIADWHRPETLNPDFLQFHTLQIDKKNVIKKPRNNQIMEVDRREQIIDLSGLEAMMAPEKPLPPIPMEEEAIYENSVVFRDERRKRAGDQPSFVQEPSSDEDDSSSPSPSLRSSTFTSSTSLAISQDVPDFSISPNLSETDLIEPRAERRIVDLECASPEAEC